MTTTQYLTDPFGPYHQAEMPPVDDSIVGVGPGTSAWEMMFKKPPATDAAADKALLHKFSREGFDRSCAAAGS